jgi:ceramide glucosyltransferase
MIGSLILFLAVLPAWAYLLAVAVLVRRFTRAPKPVATARPPVTVLKPLHGAEAGLYENLRSFAMQDYPALQVVLGVNRRSDTAVPAADALIRDLPEADIVLVADAPRSGGNGKVANLENMLPAARHDLLVLADSDMRVGPDYLAAVVAPLADPRIGLVTCLYVGMPTGGLWSRLGALQINFGFLPSAVVAEAMGLGHGCFGATIALRRETLARIGGFAPLRDELADDHRLGELVRKQGFAIRLSHYLPETRVSESSLKALWRHELRWARTVRGIAPIGFVGSIFTQPVAIAVIGAAATQFTLTSCVILAMSCLLRWASARVVAGALGLPGPSLTLLLARDCLSFGVFVASFFGRTVFWRDQHFRVDPGGRVTVDGDKAR